MGSFSSKQKTSSSSKSTSTATPNVPSFIQKPATDYYGQVSSLLAEPVSMTSRAPNANQQSAFAGAGSLSNPNAAIGEGINATRGLTGFTPGMVTAGQLGDTDLTRYLNPYTQSVIDTSMADLERGRAGAISANQSAAVGAGAYGGSRHGIVDAETNRGFMDSAGALVANLRNTGFQNAQQAALSDISNKQAADTGNADRGVTGAGIRLGAAGQLSQQGTDADANARANLGTQATLGELERQTAIENDPQQARIDQLTKIMELLKVNPSQFIGMTETGNASGTQTTKSSPSGIDSLGRILQIGQMFGGKK